MTSWAPEASKNDFGPPPDPLADPLGAPSWPQVGPKSAPSRPQVGRKTLQEAPKRLRNSIFCRRRFENRIQARIEARLGPPRRPKIMLPLRRRADFVIFAPERKTPPPEAQVGPKLGPSWPQSWAQVGFEAASKPPRAQFFRRFSSEVAFFDDALRCRAISKVSPPSSPKHHIDFY